MSLGNSDQGNISVQDGYRYWAESYDEFDNPMVAMADFALSEFLEEAKGRRILEMGCGTGRNLRKLMDLGADSVVGLDVSPEMLKVAKSKFKEHEDVKFIQHNISEECELESRSFDKVLVSLVLEHIEDLSMPFQEGLRLLKAGGSLIMLEIHPFLRLQGGRAHFQDDENGEIYLPSFPHQISDYIKMANENHLQIEKIKEYKVCPETIELCKKIKKYEDDTPLFLAIKFRKPL